MRNEKKGFVKLIIIIVIALIVLGYFGFNIKSIVQSQSVSGNLNYVWGLVVTLWNKFLVMPVTFVWEKIIVGIIWNGLVNLVSQS